MSATDSFNPDALQPTLMQVRPRKALDEGRRAPGLGEQLSERVGVSSRIRRRRHRSAWQQQKQQRQPMAARRSGGIRRGTVEDLG